MESTSEHLFRVSGPICFIWVLTKSAVPGMEGSKAVLLNSRTGPRIEFMFEF